MKIVICWTINKHRKDRRTGAISPVPRSEYAKELFQIGAGWAKSVKGGSFNDKRNLERY